MGYRKRTLKRSWDSIPMAIFDSKESRSHLRRRSAWKASQDMRVAESEFPDRTYRKMRSHGIVVGETFLEPVHPWLFLLPAHALPPSVRAGVLAERADGEYRYQLGVCTSWSEFRKGRPRPQWIFTLEHIFAQEHVPGCLKC